MFFLFLPLVRRVGRVVECGSLENYCAVRYRGFESLTLRYFMKPRFIGVFCFLLFVTIFLMIMSQKKITIVGVAVFAISVFLYYSFVFNSAVQGNKAPDFTIGLINESKYSLIQSEGNYVLLDFWASWCSPCLREIPTLIKISEKYKSSYFENRSQLDIVTVALEKRGENWKKVALKFKFNWDYQSVEYHNFILNSSLANLYGVLEIPSKFLIGPNGNIILSKTSYSEIEQYLNQRIIKNQ